MPDGPVTGTGKAVNFTAAETGVAGVAARTATAATSVAAHLRKIPTGLPPLKNGFEEAWQR